MITVVMLGQTLRDMVDETEIELEAGGSSTVRTLLEANAEKIGGVMALLKKGELLITVNRKVGALDSRVQDGDTIKLTHNPSVSFEGTLSPNP